MFGKLIKNEFRNIGRLLLLINTIVLSMHLLSIVSEQIYNSGVFKGTIFQSLFSVFVVIYIVSLIAVNIIIGLVFAVRFFRKVYSAEGYLTHTLPVSKSAIYAAILVSSSIGTLITAVLSMGYPVIRIVNEIFVTSGINFSDSMSLSAKYNITAYTVILVVLGGVLTILSTYALIFLCVSIGQNWKAHPVLGAILSYWGLTTAMQVFGVIFFASLSASPLAETWLSINRTPGDMINELSLYGIVCELVGIAIMSAISIFIMKRKLDLQ